MHIFFEKEQKNKIFFYHNFICSDLWNLSYASFRRSTLPMFLLWTLMFMKSYDTEEVNAGCASIYKDTFRDWV